MPNRKIGYELANGDTFCGDCIEKQTNKASKIAMYKDEYDDDKLPICDGCGCILNGEYGDDE